MTPSNRNYEIAILSTEELRTRLESGESLREQCDKASLGQLVLRRELAIRGELEN